MCISIEVKLSMSSFYIYTDFGDSGMSGIRNFFFGMWGHTWHIKRQCLHNNVEPSSICQRLNNIHFPTTAEYWKKD